MAKKLSSTSSKTLNNATAKTVWARKLRAFDEWFSPAVMLLGSILALVVVYIATRTTVWDMRVNTTQYRLTVAHTDIARARGLSGRAALAGHEGMIFTYSQPGRRCFWMKDMRFPVDIIWVDKQQRIAHIEQDVQPATYPKTFCANNGMYVIELRAGEVARRGMHTGQQLRF